MEPIGLATLFRPPKRAPYPGISNLWFGEAVTESGDMRMYIKQVTQEEMLSECLCAIIGRELGMNIPTAYLVADHTGVTGGDVLFGSVDAEMVSIKQRIQDNDPGIIDAMTQWRDRYGAALFDEWSANPDRHGGNLLWDGSAQWVLIDHALALWSSLKTPRPELESNNLLARLIIGLEKDMALARLHKQAPVFADQCRALDMDAVRHAAQCEQIGMSERSKIALESLQNRIDYLPVLLARYSGQKDFFA